MLALIALTAALHLADPPPLELEALLAAAEAHDPRQQQLDLLDDIAAQRVANLDARFRPQLGAQAMAAYHSEVPTVPAAFGPGPAHDQYSASLQAEQLLWDGGRTRQEKEIVAARRDLDQQRVAVDVFGVRQRLEGAFFAVLLSQAELDLLTTLEADLEAQLERMEARVEAGTALPGDAAVLGAELASQGQRRVQVLAERRAQLDVIATLTGWAIPDDAELMVPTPTLPAALHDVAEAAAAGTAVDRPELEELARARQLLAAQRELAGLASRPTVSTFAQGGVGRPADQDFFARDLTPFFVLGVRLQWKPLDWGVTDREQKILALEQAVSRSREQAFLQALSASLQQQARRIEAGQAVLAADERIVDLREIRRRQAEAQLREGVITPTDYLTERNAEHRARLVEARHRLEVVQQTVDFLTDLGSS